MAKVQTRFMAPVKTFLMSLWALISCFFKKKKIQDDDFVNYTLCEL